MSTDIYKKYLEKTNENPGFGFEITRDVLEMWGFFDYSEELIDRRSFEQDIEDKLKYYEWESKDKFSGHPSIDFVKDNSSKPDLQSQWTDLFKQIIKNKTFVLENTSGTTQEGKVLLEEQYQNALIMLRAVITKKGEDNMLKEVKRLFTLINNDSDFGKANVEALKFVVTKFDNSAKTKIPDLVGELNKINTATTPEKPTEELEDLKKELEKVNKKLDQVKIELTNALNFKKDQKAIISLLRTKFQSLTNKNNDALEYLDSEKFDEHDNDEIKEALIDIL